MPTQIKIPRIGTGDSSYTVHGATADVIHELRKCSGWENVELYADERSEDMWIGEQGRIEGRVYCLFKSEGKKVLIATGRLKGAISNDG